MNHFTSSTDGNKIKVTILRLIVLLEEVGRLRKLSHRRIEGRGSRSETWPVATIYSTTSAFETSHTTTTEWHYNTVEEGMEGIRPHMERSATQQGIPEETLDWDLIVTSCHYNDDDEITNDLQRLNEEIICTAWRTHMTGAFSGVAFV